MNDILRARTFSAVKESMAAGHLSDATSAAMVPERYQLAKEQGGRDMEPHEAHRIVSLVAMGKASNLFRNGNLAHERKGAIDYLAAMVKGERGRGGQLRFRFPMHICRCIAAVAIDEAAICMCPTCKGAKQVPTHEGIEGRQNMVVCPTCQGDGRRRYTASEHVTALARAWMAYVGTDGDSVLEIVKADIRRHPRSSQFTEAIEFAKGKLLEAERVATEETCAMVERL